MPLLSLEPPPSGGTPTNGGINYFFVTVGIDWRGGAAPNIGISRQTLALQVKLFTFSIWRHSLPDLWHSVGRGSIDSLFSFVFFFGGVLGLLALQFW
jgi:hypothetical protein